MLRHTFGVAIWVGLSGVATYFWCRDMIMAAFWPFGVTTKALGSDRGWHVSGLATWGAPSACQACATTTTALKAR